MYELFDQLGPCCNLLEDLRKAIADAWEDNDGEAGSTTTESGLAALDLEDDNVAEKQVEKKTEVVAEPQAEVDELINSIE